LGPSLLNPRGKRKTFLSPRLPPFWGQTQALTVPQSGLVRGKVRVDKPFSPSPIRPVPHSRPIGKVRNCTKMPPFVLVYPTLPSVFAAAGVSAFGAHPIRDPQVCGATLVAIR